MQSIRAVQTTPFTIQYDTYAGLRRVLVENDALRVAVLPELGGKIASIVRKASAHEFLLQLADPRKGYRRTRFGTPYAEVECSGFDECLPTIAPCIYPDEPFEGTQLPDHGEVWTKPWTYAEQDGHLMMQVIGRELPYSLQRRMRLEDSDLVLEYEMRNQSDTSFHYLWAAQPLLAVQPGDRILLPAAVKSLQLQSASDARLGKVGANVSWPMAKRKDNVSLVGPASAASSYKLLTDAADACALVSDASGESITFRFSHEELPYLGLWICQGGWPTREPRLYSISFKPSNSRGDSLVEAMGQGDCGQLPPNGTHRWHLRIELRPQPPADL